MLHNEQMKRTLKLLYWYNADTLSSLFLVAHLSIHLKRDNGQKIAVCKARYTKIAPTLHWEPTFRFLYIFSSVKKGGSSSTIENQLYLDDHFNISELICVATYPSVSGSVQLKKTLHLLPGEVNENYENKSIIGCYTLFYNCVFWKYTNPLMYTSIMVKCFKSSILTEKKYYIQNIICNAYITLI